MEDIFLVISIVVGSVCFLWLRWEGYSVWLVLVMGVWCRFVLVILCFMCVFVVWDEFVEIDVVEECVEDWLEGWEVFVL